VQVDAVEVVEDVIRHDEPLYACAMPRDVRLRVCAMLHGGMLGKPRWRWGGRAGLEI
jgi:hypothetical protein